MKKNLYKKWLEKFGDSNGLPKEKRKQVFSQIYDLVMSSVRERCSIIREEAECKIDALNKLERINSLEAKRLIETKNNLSVYMTEMYDSYHKDKMMDKNLFNSLSHYMGEQFDALKDAIHECEENISAYRNDARLLTSLLGNDTFCKDLSKFILELKSKDNEDE